MVNAGLYVVVVLVAASVAMLWLSVRSSRLGGEPRRNPFRRKSQVLTAPGDLGPDGSPFGQDASFGNDPNLEILRHHSSNRSGSNQPI